jgi:hydroxydechloroatrazine ethylaminohydrolase
MDAASQLGIRFHGGRGANTLPKSAGSNVPDEMVETLDEFLHDCQRLITKHHDPNPYSMRQGVTAPCQPINCHLDRISRKNVKLVSEKTGEDYL